MENVSLYLGHETKFWLELEKHAQELGVTDFISEIVKLRGKISFYESRIKEMSDLAAY